MFFYDKRVQEEKMPPKKGYKQTEEHKKARGKALKNRKIIWKDKIGKSVNKSYKKGVKKKCKTCGQIIKGVNKKQLDYNFKLHEEKHGKKGFKRKRAKSS